MMDQLSKDHFLQILKRYRMGNASEAEQDLLFAYYKVFDLRPGTWTERSSQNLEEEILQGIYEQIGQTERRILQQRKSVRWVWQLAAAMVFLASALFVFTTLTSKEKPQAIQISEKSLPKTNNLIQLADGTMVILSAGSRLEYPDSFEDRKKREIYLTGEAYFDVKHDPTKPFLVHTGKLTTTVLGTAFNIKAVPDSKSITITVTRGKVRVGTESATLGVLLPDQQAIYDVGSNQMERVTVNAAEAVAWKSEDLLFDDVTIASAARLIEERFNIQVIVTDEELKTKRFSTTFEKTESLESVLNSIVLFNDASYQIDSLNKQVILSPQSSQ
jgi:transmembrane sensor